MNDHKVFTLNFWSQVFMLLTASGAFIAGVTYGYRMKKLRFIPYYAMASLIQGSIGFYAILFYKDDGKGIYLPGLVALLAVIFLLLEFSLLTNFLLKSIASKRKRRLTRLAASLFVIFTILIMTYWIHQHLHGDPPIFPMESIYLIIPCLFYFYELFEFPQQGNFRTLPSFWVAAGILLYHSCSIPLFLLTPVINHKFPAYSDATYSINYILYGILFSMLIRACSLVPKVKSG